MASHVNVPMRVENVAPIAHTAAPISLGQRGGPDVITQMARSRKTNGKRTSLYGRSQTVERFTAKISIDAATAITHAPARLSRANTATAARKMTIAWMIATTECQRVSQRVRYVSATMSSLVVTIR